MSAEGGDTHLDPNVDDTEYAANSLASLLKNAINCGYAEEDVEVSWKTDEEFEAIITAILPPEPTEEQMLEERIQAKLREMAIRELDLEKADVGIS